jgi:hypothetical protein
MHCSPGPQVRVTRCGVPKPEFTTQRSRVLALRQRPPAVTPPHGSSACDRVQVPLAQTNPLAQLPQIPPQPSSPQVRPLHEGTQLGARAMESA